MDARPDLFSIGPVPDGGKDIEFKRSKNTTAGHEAADHFIQTVGECSRFLAGSHRLTEMFAMLDRHGLHRRGIVPDETIEGFAFAQMLADDFRCVGRLHAPVPCPFRVDNHHRAFIAQSHTAAGRELHIVVEAACPNLAFQRGENFGRSFGRA